MLTFVSSLFLQSIIFNCDCRWPESRKCYPSLLTQHQNQFFLCSITIYFVSKLYKCIQFFLYVLRSIDENLNKQCFTVVGLQSFIFYMKDPRIKLIKDRYNLLQIYKLIFIEKLVKITLEINSVILSQRRKIVYKLTSGSTSDIKEKLTYDVLNLKVSE